MQRTNCDLCQNPVVIHETALRSGVVKMRHLCRIHGLKLWMDAVVAASERASARSRATAPTPTVPSASLGDSREQ